ncbi:DUF4383 domain-containing protein [Streptomyces gobiensis]|uniref:DUF4383 domain-containing protein n=1 Tax=Streptomyces gobiensis TaxID=2875706 RepID=UPI001E4E674E|nr:DUF4383 domain-containing protein [Streptomyces gobiensis]UGY90305.1 DUF4383 domain-containing protein [Streptomyces gobiensis]
MMAGTGARRAPATGGALVRTAALLVGIVFLVVGALGFIPAVTTDYGAMEFAGHESSAKLFGIFQVSILHNLVHVAFGLAGLVMSLGVASARVFLIGGGLIYLALWVYGLVVTKASEANFLPVNEADDWLHFGLGLAMVVLGALPRRRSRRD